MSYFQVLTIGADDPSLLIITRVPRPGNRIFLEVASMVVTWWIVAFFCPVRVSKVFVTLTLNGSKDLLDKILTKTNIYNAKRLLKSNSLWVK